MRVDNSFKEVSLMGKKDESRCVPIRGSREVFAVVLKTGEI